MNTSNFLYLGSAILFTYMLYRLWIRLQLSKAKHPSLRGHSKWSRRIAKQLPFFDYNSAQFFQSDGAPAHIATQRKTALSALAEKTRQQNKKSLAHYKELENSVSDVKFTSNYRVPFPYKTHLPAEFKLGICVDETKGNKIKDIDGNWRFDLSGSYGVNVFGYDFYKACMEEGFEQVKHLGPVLGSYHPIRALNV